MFTVQLARLLKHLPWRRAAGPTKAAAASGPEAEMEAGMEAVLGCGWFDSSHDLHAGLCVQEHAHPDTVAQHLPLADWLELQLSDWRVTPAT
jgi:hypothetical protein